MSPRELCRNFQRGNCRYGAQCRFLHAAPQRQQMEQQKASGFGFGAQTGFQQQQQKPNPFGFGVKGGNQQGLGTDSAPRRDQFKPFSNQWIRNATPPSSRPANNQSQPENHVCTAPEICKRVISEDFQNERPMWKLTCYGHWKYFPCDIAGDISYDELRAAAYDDVKRGLSVQAIVERERNMLNSKLAEFDQLLRNPFVPQSNSNAHQPISQNAMENPFPSVSSNPSPPVVSTFSQAASLGGGLGVRQEQLKTPSPAVTAFGSPGPSFPAFGNSSPFSNSNMSPSVYGVNNSQLGSIGSNSIQFPTSMNVNSVSSSIQGSSTTGFGSIISTATVSPQGVNPESDQPSNFVPVTSKTQLINSIQGDSISGDASIWLKEKWNIGEIPEEAPPDAYV